MSGYLFGSSVQGIQGYIFETNKLKEIAGASELVESLCTDMFREYVKSYGITEKITEILTAAGNIRVSTDCKSAAEKLVYGWVFFASQRVPGVYISQALLHYETLSHETMTKLEMRLKIQRNKPALPAELAPMAAARCSRTGRPACWPSSQDKLDRITLSKQNSQQSAASELMKKSLPYEHVPIEKFPFDINNICRPGSQDWLAVVHADGNGLGSILQKLGERVRSGDTEVKDVYRNFSSRLEESTTQAAKAAASAVLEETSWDAQGNRHLPFRMVVLGGDDLTIIIRADLALLYTKVFLERFEEISKNQLGDMNEGDGLTACAGIAFMKPSFPIHYAYELAEQLCSRAKNQLERRTGLAFHKIQDSFLNSYEDIVTRELTCQSGLELSWGAYGKDDIERLIKQVAAIKTKEAPSSGIRKWLHLLYENDAKADLWLERVRSLSTRAVKQDLDLDNAISNNAESGRRTHLYDVMSLASVVNKE